MQGNRSRDTAPEKALRSALHARGYRYRVSARPVPGLRRTADLVFRRARVAVFVDGCYWHGCDEHYSQPATNAAYWSGKIGRNQARDSDTDRRLRDAGWVPVRVWEHEPLDDAVARVVGALSEALAGPGPPTRRAGGD